MWATVEREPISALISTLLIATALCSDAGINIVISVFAGTDPQSQSLGIHLCSFIHTASELSRHKCYIFATIPQNFSLESLQFLVGIISVDSSVHNPNFQVVDALAKLLEDKDRNAFTAFTSPCHLGRNSSQQIIAISICHRLTRYLELWC